MKGTIDDFRVGTDFIAKGFLGGEPEMKMSGKEGDTVTSISIGIGGNDKYPAQWLKAEAWGENGKLMNDTLAKGMFVAVRGFNKQHRYQEKVYNCIAISELHYRKGKGQKIVVLFSDGEAQEASQEAPPGEK